MNTDANTIGAVETSFAILESLKELNGARVTDVANHLEIPKSTAHDHLQTLYRAECVVKEGDDYRVGARFLELGGHARANMRLYRVAKEEVDKLADETGEQANLMIEEHGRGIFLHQAHGRDAVTADTYPGKRIYLQTTALGKCILAHLPDERVSSIIDRHGLPEITKNSITTPEELTDELEAVRERGYAIDDEERIEGMKCIAAPIIDRSDDVLGAVSVSGPTSRMQGQRFEEEIPSTVRRAANIIEVTVTYS